MARWIARLALVGAVLFLTACTAGGPFDFFKNFGKSSPPPRTVPLESDLHKPKAVTTEGSRNEGYPSSTRETETSAPASTAPEETVNPVSTPSGGTLSPLQAGPTVTPVPAGMTASQPPKAAAPAQPERPGLIETGTMSPATKKPHQ